MASTSPSLRSKLLRKFQRRPHRYSIIRFATQATTLAILYLVPLTGLARFDLWGAEHRALFRPANAVDGFVAVAVGVTSLYVITFLANVVCGRLFCGWGCPVAQLSRFGELIEGGGWRAALRGGSFGALLVLGVMLWWTSPRIVVDGSATARAVGAAVFLGLLALTYVHGKVFRWEFCKKACPIGLYYSVVATETSHGIVFERDLETCKACNVCDRVCPVDLHPRALSSPRVGIGGLGIDGLPEDNHCLRCGDCVTACEFVFAREELDRVPLRFGFGRNGEPLVPRPRFAVEDASPRSTLARTGPVSASKVPCPR